MEFWLTVVALGTIYLIVALSLDLLAAEIGLLSCAHAALFGLGAYGAALADTLVGAPWWLGLLIGVGLAVLGTVIVGALSFWIRDDFFVMVSLAFGLILYGLYFNLVWLTGGDSGIVNVTPWRIGGLGASLSTIVIASAVACAIAIGRSLLRRAPIGRAWRAVGEDEGVAVALGINPRAQKLMAFVVSGAIAGLAGVLFAHYTTFVDPSAFSVHESIFVLSLVVIGGIGSFPGVVAGTAIGIGLPELFRFLQLTGPEAALLRQIVFGLFLVAFVAVRPRGLIGRANSVLR
jgi:branched-chain amino acid transport system permease protein